MNNLTNFDVLVVGATPGGIVFAVRSAREGLSVLLTNWNNHPGASLSTVGIFLIRCLKVAVHRW